MSHNIRRIFHPRYNGTVEHYLSIIIGAGQAGLATAHQLTSRGLIPAQDFLLIDANPAPRRRLASPVGFPDAGKGP